MTLTFLGSLALVITAVAGAIIGIIKIRPETTRAIVAASTELNASHRGLVEVLERQATRLREANEARDTQLEHLRQELSAAKTEIMGIRRLHAEEISRLIANHEADVRSIQGLRDQVRDLRTEVNGLRSETRPAV